MSQLRLRALQSTKRSPLGFLQTLPMFRVMNDLNALVRLAELMWARDFTAGEILIEVGEIQTSLLIFVEGSAVGSRCQMSQGDGSVITPFAQTQRVLVCDAGTTYGEAALIDASPSDLTLAVETDGFCWCLDAQAFEQFAHEYPRAALKMQNDIARRYLSQLKKAQETLRLYQTLLAAKGS